MRGGNLAIAVLQDVGVCALQDAGTRACVALLRAQARSVFTKFTPATASFNADHFYIGIAQKSVEKPNGVRAATNTREQMRWQTLFRGENLFAGLAANDGLKITHHSGIRMRAEHGPEQIMRGAHIGDPVSHGFVDGVFQSAAAGINGDDLRAEQTHPCDIERLPRHVFRAHVDDAFEPEMRSDSGGSHAMLASAGFRDDARLADLQREQSLPD